MPDLHNYIRRPRAATKPLTALDVAKAYNYPKLTGKGYKAGIIELGGGFGQADLNTYFGGLGLPVPNVVSVPVAGGKNQSDGPDGADGEVLLDIEVLGAVAPDAEIRVYFAPNSDSGFLAAINQAVADGCHVMSISWGQAESQWSSSSLQKFDAAFLAARTAGCVVFAAAGDSGSKDSTGSNVTDFPASSPNVIGCGGTRLTVNSDGSRSSEVVWDDSDTTSATGGGVSKVFPGRQVPDVAGNADPYTGYEVVVDGEQYVIGGTSAVAPLYAGLTLLLCEGVDAPVGQRVDVLNTLTTNPGVFFDVTAGDNGGYRAGVGRDDVTGMGVADGSKLLGVLTDSTADPAPIGGGAPFQPPQPVPTPTPTPDPTTVSIPSALAKDVTLWARRCITRKGDSKQDKAVAQEWLDEVTGA